MAYCAQGTVLSKKERTVSVGRRPRRPRSQTCKFSEHAHVHVISFFSRPFTGVGAVVVLCCRCLIFCRERGISRLNYFMPSLDDHSTSEGLRASGRPRQRATNHKNTSLDVECGPTRGASGASAKSPSRLAACLTKARVRYLSSSYQAAAFADDVPIPDEAPNWTAGLAGLDKTSSVRCRGSTYGSSALWRSDVEALLCLAPFCRSGSDTDPPRPHSSSPSAAIHAAPCTSRKGLCRSMAHGPHQTLVMRMWNSR